MSHVWSEVKDSCCITAEDTILQYMTAILSGIHYQQYINEYLSIAFGFSELERQRPSPA